MNKESYDNLILELDAGTCVLVIGPELFLLQNGDESLIENLRDVIYKEKEKLKNKSYLSEDGFFYVSRGNLHDKKTIFNEIKDYYKALKIPNYYDYLSRLPFKLVINLSPDTLFSKALHKSKRQHRFFYLKKGGSTIERIFDKDNNILENRSILDGSALGSPSINNPWIFNLLGVYDDSDSLVFTYDALFEFLYTIFPITNLPNNLRLEIQKATTFLFLGFEYNKWYLKIIFFLLQKNCEGTGVEKKAIFDYNDAHLSTVDFYTSQFDLTFFRESTVSRIEKLHNDCKNLWFPTQMIPSNNANILNKLPILYICSQPSDKSYLRFDNEFKIVQDLLKQSEFKNKYSLEFRPSVTQRKFLSSINEISPNILIVSLHGNQTKGLLFRGDHGESDPLDVETFEKDIRVLMHNLPARLNIVIFSCCHSSSFANILSNYVPHTIGMEGPVPEEVMVEFFEGFFDSYFLNEEVSQAVEFGRRFIERKNRMKDYAKSVHYYSKALALNSELSL